MRLLVKVNLFLNLEKDEEHNLTTLGRNFRQDLRRRCSSHARKMGYRDPGQ